MNYFTADLHLYSDFRIKDNSRPFDCSEDFVEFFIENTNLHTTSDDTLYVIGDWFNYISADRMSYLKAFEVVSKLNCRVVLIIGNNEHRLIVDEYNGKFNDFRSDCLKAGFDDVLYDAYLTMWGKSFYLTHKPVNCKLGLINLFGHVHITGSILPIGINVGIDHNYCRIFSEDLIYKIMSDVIQHSEEDNFKLAMGDKKVPLYLWKSYVKAYNATHKTKQNI